MTWCAGCAKRVWTRSGTPPCTGTLRRLYKAGLLTTYVVASEEGPHRKYYSLNELGRARFVESAKTWRGFAATMERLLGEEL